MNMSVCVSRGGATILKVREADKNVICERNELKKLYTHFSKCGKYEGVRASK